MHARRFPTGVTGAAVLLAMLTALGGTAQGKPPPKNTSSNASTPAPATSQSTDAEPIKLSYTPWVKSCTQDSASGKRICFTVSSGSAETGPPVVAAMLIEREGDARKVLRVVLPLGMQLVHGTRIIVDNYTPVLQPFVGCTTSGCISDYEATADLMANLKTGNNLIVQAINSKAAALTLPLPLGEFGHTIEAAPVAWSSLDSKIVALLQDSLGYGKKDGAPTQTATPTLTYSPWTKFCLKGQDANAMQVCFTGKDGRIESGQPLIAGVIIEPEGEPKKVLRVTVPLGMALQDGTRIVIDNKAPLSAPYVICFQNGCMSDYEATPDLIASLKRGQSLFVQAITNSNQVITLPLPLMEGGGTGFAHAYDGPPADPKVFEANQKKLQDELQKLKDRKLAETSQSTAPADSQPPSRPIASQDSGSASPATSRPSSPVATAPMGRRVALVIGNSAYQNVPTLPNPVNDASDMSAALSRLGFGVKAIRNANYDDMRRALIDFGRQALGADIAVIYFAGHGIQMSGENWLIPVDAQLASDRDVENEAISLQAMSNAVSSTTRLGMVILDACRSNPFVPKMHVTNVKRDVERGFSRVEPSDNVLVAYAAHDGTTARDGDGRNSPFTQALLNNIEKPGLEINYMFRIVRDQVMQTTHKEQQPYVYGSLSSDLIYLKNPQ